MENIYFLTLSGVTLSGENYSTVDKFERYDYSKLNQHAMINMNNDIGFIFKDGNKHLLININNQVSQLPFFKEIRKQLLKKLRNETIDFLLLDF